VLSGPLIDNLFVHDQLFVKSPYLFFPNFFQILRTLLWNFPDLFFMTRNEKGGQNDAKPHICHSNHHSIKFWHPFDLKQITVTHRHLNIPYTDLQEVLRSSERGRGHERRGIQSQFQAPPITYSRMRGAVTRILSIGVESFRNDEHVQIGLPEKSWGPPVGIYMF
jgi:hypothetical protein